MDFHILMQKFLGHYEAQFAVFDFFSFASIFACPRDLLIIYYSETGTAAMPRIEKFHELLMPIYKNRFILVRNATESPQFTAP